MALDVAPLYSIGRPTDEEQLALEYINRSRADASAEAWRHKTTTDPDVLAAYAYYSVNLDLMTNQFASLAQHVAPLAMSSNLLTAARLHSQDMFANVFQGHVSSTNPPLPNQPGDVQTNRVNRQGYAWIGVGENVYAYGKSAYQVHAAFDVDWGTNAGGMQVPPGHRLNLHTNAFREIGIGIVRGSKSNGATTVGPMILTQDFGTQAADTPFVTGVAFYDLNTNGFYDAGEGLGGVDVQVAGAAWGAVTAESGGYAVPVSSDATFAVTFSGTNLAAWSTNAVVAGGRNVKADYRPTYAAPLPAGTTSAATGTTYTYTYAPVGGVTNHRLRVYCLSTNAWEEGAESGTNNVQVNTSAPYAVVQSDVVSKGTKAFHLAQTSAVEQTVTLIPSFYVGGGASLSFASRLGYSTTGQVAAVRLSDNDGGTWQTVYAQAGTNGAGEGAFGARVVPVSAYSGRVVRIRFSYDILPGASSIYPQTNTVPPVGWFFDAITGSNLLKVASVTSNSLGASSSFPFTPDALGLYLLQLRGEREGREFPYGPALQVTAGPPTLSVTITNAAFQAGASQVRIVYRAEHGVPSAAALATAPAVTGTYVNVPGLSPTDLGGGSYRFVHSLDGSTSRFFRVRATP
jgi:hypothetical protein